MLDVVEGDPELRRRVGVLVHEAIAPTTPKTEPTAIYMRRGAYAKRVGVCVRTLDAYRDAGLPCVGEGRRLRIDVAAADAWLKRYEAPVADVEERARREARRS